MEIKSVLVTGSSGQLGQELCKQLETSTDLKIWRVSRSSKGQGHVNVDFEEDWDIGQLPAKCDAVIHLAQSSEFRNFPDGALSVFRVNIASTAKLLDYAKKAGVSKFVYASSGGVYGYRDTPFKEDAQINTFGKLGNYLHSKICGELLVRDYERFFNVDILRFFFVYGENQEQSMLIPRLVENVIKGNQITLAGKDGIIINPIYVSDAASAVVKTLFKHTSGIYNVAGDEKISIRTICDIIGEITGKVVKYKYTDALPLNLLGDSSKMRLELHAPCVNMNEGITRIFRKHEK